MPYKGHKSITITEANDDKLGLIKEQLSEKSKSSTANKLIEKEYSRLKNKKKSEVSKSEANIKGIKKAIQGAKEK